MIEDVKRILFYTPDVERALAFYETLGLRVDKELPSRDGRRAVELAFPDGNARLVLHSDPLLQFTDVELKVGDVREAYRTLKCDPSVLWLQLPTQTLDGWRASLRGPDGNVLVLSSDAEQG